MTDIQSIYIGLQNTHTQHWQTYCQVILVFKILILKIDRHTVYFNLSTKYSYSILTNILSNYIGLQNTHTECWHTYSLLILVYKILIFNRDRHTVKLYWSTKYSYSIWTNILSSYIALQNTHTEGWHTYGLVILI